MAKKTTKPEADASRRTRKKRRSLAYDVARRFFRNKGAVVGMIIVATLVFIGLFADVIFDYETQIVAMNSKARLLAPSWEHPFGTDAFGRDLFCRLLYGTKYSLAIGVSATVLTTCIGVPIGALAGYYGGTFEDIVMRLMDILGALPSILLGTVIVSALGTSMVNLIIAMSVVGIAGYSRTARVAVMTVKNNEYIESARMIGMKEWDLIVSHILPNCLSPIIVQITMHVASVIVAASSLSFLGLGVPEPSPEWGALLSAGRAYLRQNSNLTLYPGLAIMITVLALNLMGDGLRDAMDPKLRK